MRKNDTAEIICWAIGCGVGLLILMHILPYIILFLALVGAYYLYEQYSGNNRR